jgi:hypothetical protein
MTARARGAARPLWLAALLLILAASTRAAVPSQLVDDSATLPYDAMFHLTWRSLAPHHGGASDNTLVGTTPLRVHLNVAPWLHHSGRIYLVLPAQPPGDMQVSWTTQGRLMPGNLRPGSRTLVYAGRINTPFIEDQVLLSIAVDAARLQQLTHVNFHFEIDED